MKTTLRPEGTISIVIPLFNEQDSIQSLYQRIASVMSDLKAKSYEVVFIDDGSTDSSWEQLLGLYNENPRHVKLIKLRKNFGKSAALNAGFNESCGEIVFTMDADLQDDPEEIPNFLDKLNEGFDLVSGWKKNRKDPFSKKMPSKIFNKITTLISGIKLNDFNCGFKAYRKEVLKFINLYGELHRYIPVLANEYGFKIGEITVRHHPRAHGSSKYGFERYARGFLDLLTVIVTTKYLQRPGHLFGGIGIGFGLFGTLSLIYLVIIWFLGYRPIGTRPLLLFGIMSTVLSVQLISLGLLAEHVNRGRPHDEDKLIEKIVCKVQEEQIE